MTGTQKLDPAEIARDLTNPQRDVLVHSLLDAERSRRQAGRKRLTADGAYLRFHRTHAKVRRSLMQRDLTDGLRLTALGLKVAAEVWKTGGYETHEGRVPQTVAEYVDWEEAEEARETAEHDAKVKLAKRLCRGLKVDSPGWGSDSLTMKARIEDAFGDIGRGHICLYLDDVIALGKSVEKIRGAK